MAPDSINESIDCSAKSTTDVLFQKDYFISNITCSSSTVCLGTKQNPFDSIINTFNYIIDIDKAEKYQEQVLAIYLLGSPHYILNSELSKSQARFFRRMNATILISPWFCEDENLSGCLWRNNSERATIVFKTFSFTFEIHRNLTMSNVDLFGNDIVLQNTSSQTCYNKKQICCLESNLDSDFSNDECGLQGRSVNILPKNMLTNFYGVFTLRMLYNEDLTLSSSLNESPLPGLNLMNVSFQNFISINDNSWSAFLIFGTLGYTIYLENIAFVRNYYKFGLIYFSKFEEDPYSKNYANSIDISAFYMKYPRSLIYNFSFLGNSLLINEYNRYNIQPSSETTSMINIFDEQNPNTFYSFENITVSSMNLSTSLYFFSFQTILPEIHSFNFSKIIFANNTFLKLFMISFGQIDISELSFMDSMVEDKNSISMNPDLIYLSFSTFNCNNCSFSNFNLSYYLITSLNCNIILSNSLFIQIENLQFSMMGGSLILNSDRFIDLYFYLEGYFNTLMIFQLNDMVMAVDDVLFSNWICPTKSNLNIFGFFNPQLPLVMTLTNIFVQNVEILSQTPFQVITIFIAAEIVSVDVKFIKCSNIISDFFVLMFVMASMTQKISLSNIEFMNASNVYVIYVTAYFKSMDVSNCSFFNSTIFQGFLDVSSLSEDSVFSNWKFNQSVFGIPFNVGFGTNFVQFRYAKSVLIESFVFLACDFSQISLTFSQVKSFFLGIYGVKKFELKNFDISDSNSQFLFCFLNLENIQNVSITGLLLSDFNLSQNSVFQITNCGNILWNYNSISDCVTAINAVVNFYQNSYIEIKNSFFKNNVGKTGSSFYLNQIQNILMLNVSFSNMTATDGGSIYLETIGSSNISNIKIENSTSLFLGGAFYISNCSNLIFSNMSITLGFSGDGGGSIYGISSNVIIYNSTFSSSSEYSGGGILIKGSTSMFLLNNAAFVGCFAFFEGSNIFSFNIKNLTVINSKFMSTLSQFQVGSGGIKIEGYEYDPNKIFGKIFYFNNNSFINNSGKALCINYDSNSKFVMKNIKLQNNSGTLFSMISDSSQILEFANIEISETNNYLKDGKQLNADYLHPLFIFQHLNFTFNGFFVENNFHEINFFEIASCNVDFFNISLKNMRIISSGIPQYIFYSYKSKITLGKIKVGDIGFFTSISTNFCFSDSSTIFIADGYFQDQMTNNLFQFYLIDSFWIIDSSSFEGLFANNAIFQLKHTNLTVKSSFFRNTSNTNAPFFESNFLSIFYVEDESLANDFILIENLSYQGSDKTNFISCTNLFNLTIISSSFNSDKLINQKSSSRALIVFNSSVVSLISNQFSNFNSSKGGALYIATSLDDLTSGTMQVLISNCTFSYNIAELGGAIYFRGSILMKIKLCNFNNNQALLLNQNDLDAGVGGCIVSDCEYFKTCQIFINSSEFINNSADVFEPTFLIKNIQNSATLKYNIFIGNTFMNQYQAENGTSTPFSLLFSSQVSFILENYTKKVFADASLNDNQNFSIASGQEFDFEVLLIDAHQNLLLKDFKATASLTCQSDIKTENIRISNGLAISKSNYFLFSNVQIIAVPNRNLSCQISVNYDESFLIISSGSSLSPNLQRTISKKITIFSRRCLRGEILMEDNTCRKCQPNSFSLKYLKISDNTSSCVACPENALCEGGDTLYPKSGSWRNSENSSLILYCPMEEGCMGSTYLINGSNSSQMDLIRGLCGENYFGNLCAYCQSGYFRLREDSFCRTCSSSTWVYAKVTLIFCYMAFLIGIHLKIYHSAEIGRESFFQSSIKLFINHWQMLSLIFMVNSQWTATYDGYFLFQEFLGCVGKDIYQIECLIDQKQLDPLIQNIVFLYCSPFIITLALFIIILLIYCIRRFLGNNDNLKLKTSLSKNLKIILATIYIIFYPEFLLKSFQLLNCTKIDDWDNTKVVSVSPNIICSSENHIIWFSILSLPIIIIWGVIIPFLIFAKIMKNKYNITNESSKIRNQNPNSPKKNKKKIIEKKVTLILDEYVKEKILPTTSLPVENKMNLKVEDKFLIEIIEVRLKEELKVESKSKITQKTDVFSSIQIDIKFENKSFLIIEPEALIEWLSFIEGFELNALKRSDLENHPVQVSIRYSEVDKSNYKKRATLISKKSTVKNTDSVTKDFQLEDQFTFYFHIDFNEEHCFWEIILFLRKFLLVLIVSVTELFPNETQMINILIVIILAYYLQIKYEPYYSENLNKLENVSMLVALICISVEIIFKSAESNNNSAYLAFFFFLILLNSLFTIAWIYYIGKERNIFTMLKKNMEKTFRMLKQITKNIFLKAKQWIGKNRNIFPRIKLWLKDKFEKKSISTVQSQKT